VRRQAACPNTTPPWHGQTRRRPAGCESAGGEQVVDEPGGQVAGLFVADDFGVVDGRDAG